MKNEIIFFLLFFSYNIQIKSIIVLPFEKSQPNKNSKQNYSFDDFFSDNLFIDFFTTLHIGKDNTKVLARISTLNHIFSFSKEECNKKSLEQSFDYSLVIKRGYPLYQSLSYKNISNKDNYLIISEIFSLYNTTYQSSIPPSLPRGNFIKENKLIDKKTTINDMKILIEDKNIYNNKYCALIGLNTPNNKNNNEINFINELKRLDIINDYSWTFIFFSSGAGQLIIGGLPHEYLNSDYYQKKQYIKIESNSVADYELPWSITFNQILFENKERKKIIIQNNAKAYLIPNLGFIIGTNEYKKYIIDNYFEYLFKDNVCHKEKLKNININSIKGEFETFSCDETGFNHKRKELNFPNLNLIQKDKLNYTFVLSSFDLFMKINDKYYFLIIFPEDKSNNNWYLGFPFHKNYQFVFNYDSKTLGFYAYRSEGEDEAVRKDKPIEIGDIKINTNLSGYSYKRIIIEILICVLLVVLAFFIGKKINKERKKKANELKDENYEYFSSDINSNIKKDSTKIKSNYNEIKSNSNNKLMEMSSNFGI